MERFDPCGAERLELMIATLISVVQGIVGKAMRPDEIAPDWGGLRVRARAKEAEVDYEALAEERERGAL